MQVVNLIVGPVRTNCYLVKSGDEIGIVDGGGDDEKILQAIKDLGGKPVWVVATHGHFDHVISAPKLTKTFNIPFYLHPKDQFLLERAEESAKKYAGMNVDLKSLKVQSLKEGMELKIGKDFLQIWETPGHTPGGVSFYQAQGKMIFCGDVVFTKGVIGRTDLPHSLPEEGEKSLQRILSLPDETLLYPAHGRLGTIGTLKENLGQKNPH